MNQQVIKIGGSCLADLGSLDQLVKISSAWPNSIIVVSAFKGITDSLYRSYNSNERFEYVENLIRSYSGELSKLQAGSPEKLFDRMLSMIRFRNFEDFEKGIANCDQDFYVSLGERISGAVCTIFLERYTPTSYLDSFDTGIFIRKYEGESTIDLKKSISSWNGEFRDSIGKVTIITTGFYGKDENGKVAIAGRNSSDSISSVIALKVRSEKLILFKDVDGIYPADPNKFEVKSPIKEMDYDTAMNFAIEGKIIHPDAIRVCKGYNIKMEIYGYFNLKKGTTILNPDSYQEREFSFPETF